MICYEALLDGAGRKTPEYSQILEAKQNPSWKGLRSKTNLRRESPACNHLSDGKTQN